MPDTALIVMARYPRPGFTKTRLARTLGNERTSKLYQAFLHDLATRFAGRDCDLHWAYTPPELDFATFLASLVPDITSGFRCFPQEGTDLNERLLRTFQYTCQQGYAASIVIGSDSPQIAYQTVVQARQALQEVDVVLGPAEDGGYYLLGMRSPHDLFNGIPMSTSEVASMTIARAHELGLTVRSLDPLFDVDEYADLMRLAALLQTDRSLAPATAAQIADCI